MGCTQSKIENEEAVTRCKDRKMHMKEAVTARNLFAAAHSAYTMALKNTGAALSDYGPGEVLDTVLSHTATAQPPRETLPPPPPLPDFSPDPIARSISMPEMPLPKSDPKPAETIQEEEDVYEEDDVDDPAEPEPEPTTPASPPPPPPPTRPQSNPVVPPPEPSEDRNPWDFFIFPEMDAVRDSYPIEVVLPPPPVREQSNPYREEKFKRKDGDGAEGSKSRSGDSVEKTREKAAVEPPAKTMKKPKQGSSSSSGNGGSTSSSMIASEGPKRVKAASASNTSLLQILNELDDHFLKASESAHEVSKMLEANRMHYHSNFADNRGAWTLPFPVLESFVFAFGVGCHA